MSELDKGKKTAVIIAFFFVILVMWMLFWIDYKCPPLKVVAYVFVFSLLMIFKMLLGENVETAAAISLLWASTVMVYITACFIF